MVKNETFLFVDLPCSTEALQALPEAALSTPYQTAALTTLVLCRYADNPQETVEMLNYLKGPQMLSRYDI
ncbi:MAG: DUF6935 domain-containing protein [Christensenellales bacterium]|jgi:hypothetical protein